MVGRRGGFTLIETMIAACLLTIILGLGVSLSRHVRGQSARTLTKDVLGRLEIMLQNYTARNGPGQVPVVVNVEEVRGVAAGDPEIADMATFRMAMRNNGQFLNALRIFAADKLKGLPLSVYDPGAGGTVDAGGVRDAWGTPIVLVNPRETWVKGALGSSPKGGSAPFFVSAGPDRKFLEKGKMDNLYSYETLPKGQ